MVVHMDADRHHAWIVSVPREAWVDLTGRGENEVNVGHLVAASVVLYDRSLGDRLWRAMAQDSMAAFVAAHPELLTPARVR